MMHNPKLAGSSYPLWHFEFYDFDPALAWRADAMIPGYVFFWPTKSAADVEAVARFDDGVWTVELRRLRHTGNADDVVF
jgi:hypothetical protein